MRYSTLGIIFYQLAVLSRGVKTGTKLSRHGKNYPSEILEAVESRYRHNYDYPDRDYDRIPRRDYDLPVTFKAPNYEAPDYWSSKENQYSNRRTFFDHFSYDPHGKTTPYPNFYQFMTSLFGGRDEVTPQSEHLHHYERNRITPHYHYDGPPNFRPTEPNYIPPPKPIRASVIKLETVTRPPIYPPFETTTKFYPHVGSILNHVLIENSKANQNSNFNHPHSEENVHIPPFKPLPVLPKPHYVPPTTLKPVYPNFINNAGFRHSNSDPKYPKSVQDQLPHLNQGGVEIPYVSEEPDPAVFYTRPPPEKSTLYTRSFPTSDSPTTINTIDLIDIRGINFDRGNEEGREKSSRNPHFEFDATTVRSFPGAIEKVERPIYKFTKKLTAQLDRSSVERITNLTVQGYSNVGKESSRKQVNYVNVLDLVNYEMEKFNNSDAQNTNQETSTRPVNLYDELSLDAKILKDTNWDGLTVLPTSTTTEAPRETTTILTVELKRNKTAFWEIPETKATPEPNTPTTTEFVFWTSTSEPAQTHLFFTTETITPKTTEEIRRRSDNKIYITPVTENVEVVETTTPTEKTTTPKRYSRRPKVINFTPYPSPEEIQKKLINRPNFPKRQKPNITLSFGNKAAIRPRQSIPGKVEAVTLSEKESSRRKKIGKRRHVVKRIRVSTTEQPIPL